MKKQEYQRRVRRIIEGNFGKDDIDRLFLHLREQPGRKASTKEIGDFIAHNSSRNQGGAVNHIRALFESLEAATQVSRDDIASAPIYERRAVAHLALLSDEKILRATGMSRSKAKSSFDRAIKKLKLNQRSSLSANEYSALRVLGESMGTEIIFTDADIINDFCEGALSADLIKEADQEFIKSRRIPVALHVLTTIHGTRTTLKNGNDVAFKIDVHPRTRTLQVVAEGKLKTPTLKGDFTASMEVIRTSIPCLSGLSLGLVAETCKGSLDMALEVRGGLIHKM